MSKHSRRRITESFAITFVLIVIFLGTAALGQYRQVDQGRGGTTTGQVWLVKICDQNGANCGTVAIPVTVTGTMTVTGTVQSNAGTGTVNVTCVSGCGGAATFSDASAFVFGTTPIGNIGAVVDDVATNTVAENSAAIPRMSANRVLYLDLKNTQTNTAAITVTGTVQNNGGTVTATPTGTTTITGTVSATSGTINSMPSLTVTSGTVNSATISSMPAVSVTSATMPTLNIGTFGPALNIGTFGPTVTVTGTVQNNGGTVTATPTGTTTITGTVQANAGTGTLNVDDIANGTIGSAVPTNGMFAAGVVRTDTIAKGSAGNMIGLQLDNQGRLVVGIAPPEMQSSARATLTATTASSMFAAPGANYKYAITFMSVCNGSGTVAGQVDITDSSGTIYSFPWTQTATTAGEPRCYTVSLGSGDPIFSAANSTISAKASAANGTGFFVNVALHKTGT